MIKDFLDKNKNKKVLLISHGNCSDGFGAAWAVWKNCNKDYNIEYKFMKHGDKLNFEEIKNKAILFTDFVLDRATMSRISQSNPVFIVDHHIDAKNDLEGFKNSIIDITQAASVLAWKNTSNEPVPALLKFVEDRDLQMYKLPFSNEILQVLSTVKKDFEEWNDFHERLNENISEVIENGRVLKRQYKKYLNDIISNAQDIEILGNKGKIVNANWEFASDAAEELAKGGDFAISWFAEKDGTIRTSWRSVPGSKLKVNWLAGFYGGGGHEHSAGAHINIEDLKSILNSENPKLTIINDEKTKRKIGVKI